MFSSLAVSGILFLQLLEPELRVSFPSSVSTTLLRVYANLPIIDGHDPLQIIGSLGFLG